MFRYYTTPETRQALIAESNRLIADRRAAMNAARGRRDEGGDDGDAFERAELAAKARAEVSECSESAFARLVADLQSTSMAAGVSARV